MIKLTTIYIDESGTTVATDRYRPNEERYEPALKLTQPGTRARSSALALPGAPA